VISTVKPTKAAKAIVAAGLLYALLQTPPAEAQVQQLMGLATKAVPMLIMQGVKEYKKATDPAYAKAEKERPRGKDADDAFLDGDNFKSEWKQLGKQNSHIRLQESAVEGDVDGAAQAIKDKAARKAAREASKNGAKDDSESDVKQVLQAAKPAIVAPPREGSDWFLDEDEASTRKISAKVSKPKLAEQDDASASATLTHTESVQGKLLKSPVAETTSTKPTVTDLAGSGTAKNKNAEAEKPEASGAASESAPIIMMPISK